ncbi:MAG: hypothetical protein SFZ23_00725 [Planctomycetota bacterium]|nr:hypothetical protein [Planctomycetota bacterium]
MTLVQRLYARRIVNVNVNVVAAGLLALLPTIAVVHVLTVLGWIPHPSEAGSHHKLLIGAITFIADVVFDVAIYYALHWLANHMPRVAAGPTHSLEVGAQPTFLRDATQVQVERMALSPLFYIVALGGQHVLLQLHVPTVTATGISFGIAILVTRTIHTFWMLRNERRARRVRLAKLEPIDPGSAAPSASTPPATSTEISPSRPAIPPTPPSPAPQSGSSPSASVVSDPAAHRARSPVSAGDHS